MALPLLVGFFKLDYKNARRVTGFLILNPAFFIIAFDMLRGEGGKVMPHPGGGAGLIF
ncbi:hypothetical protein ACIUVT_000919 [Yersinia enterocolitica]